MNQVRKIIGFSLRSFLVLLLLTCLSQVAVAQENNYKNSHKNLVALTKKVIGQIAIEDQEAFHLKYRQTSTTRDRMDLPMVVDVEVKIKGKVKHMTSAQMDLFMDDKNAFVVYKEAQRIFNLKNTLKAQGNLQEQLKASGQDGDVAALLEAIWTKSIIKEVNSPKKGARLLELKPTELMQKASQVARIWLLFDQKTLRLERVQLQMVEASFTKTIDFEYLLIDKAPSFKKLAQPKRQIFDATGKLHKRYKGYSLQEV